MIKRKINLTSRTFFILLGLVIFLSLALYCFDKFVTRVSDRAIDKFSYERRVNNLLERQQDEKISLYFQGEQFMANQGGIERKIIDFLNSDQYAQATLEELKKIWFNFDNVQFEYDSTYKLLPGSDEQLENIVKILAYYPDVKIKIGSYTDKKGDEEVNRYISQKRAEFIRDQLQNLGMENTIVAAEGFGSEFAQASADDPEAERAKDRFVAIRFDK